MKKMSSTQTVLLFAFAVLLMACLIQYMIRYKAGQRAEDDIQSQATLNQGSNFMNAQVRANNDALFREKEKIIQRGQEMERLGLHGEERNNEIQRQAKLAEQEMQHIRQTQKP